MPVTPQRAREAAAQEMIQYQDAIAGIDQQILALSAEGRPVVVTHACLGSPRLLTRIRDTYTQAGWEVTNLDQNGAKFLKLEPKEAKSNAVGSR